MTYCSSRIMYLQYIFPHRYCSLTEACVTVYSLNLPPSLRLVVNRHACLPFEFLYLSAYQKNSLYSSKSNSSVIMYVWAIAKSPRYVFTVFSCGENHGYDRISSMKKITYPYFSFLILSFFYFSSFSLFSVLFSFSFLFLF